MADGQRFTHQILNTKTGQVVGKYSSVDAARTAMDKKDNAYGAYVHKIVPIVTSK